ncbi:MAG: ferredoxin [Bacteroidales bacterium]|nr:ferredoxin [Bacteroidales bacterium]
MESSDNKKSKISRREFINSSVRFSIVLGIGAIGGRLLTRSHARQMVWQLDTSKCIQCGRCATNCVKTPSAVKCVHVYSMCGYCDLCGGYFRPETKELTTAAENQLCPTSAIRRKFVEDPFFQYDIDEKLCIGCGKCVKGCGAFGNGSLQLQVRHDLCDNCNECAIARDCPAGAFSRVSSDSPYLFSGFDSKKKG